MLSAPYYRAPYWRIDYIFIDEWGNKVQTPHAQNKSLNELMASIHYWDKT